MLKAAVIGTGMAGHELGLQLQQRADVAVVGAVDVNLSVAARFCERFGGRAFASVGAMVRDAAPDLVAVASTNSAHADNVIEAVEAGVQNVFCEKPLAIDLEDAARMVAVVEAAGVRTSLGFSGLEPGMVRATEIVSSGRLGRILHAQVQLFRGYGFWGQERINRRGVRSHHAAVMHPQESGGWTIHHACHMFFILTRMLGPARSVFGRLASSTLAAPSEELVTATLQFENDASGALLDSIGSFRGLELIVIGTSGTMCFRDDLKKNAQSIAELTLHMEGADQPDTERFPYKARGRTRLLELVDAILQKCPSPITFKEAMDNLLICAAVRQSSDLGLPVELANSNAAVCTHNSGRAAPHPCFSGDCAENRLETAHLPSLGRGCGIKTLRWGADEQRA